MKSQQTGTEPFRISSSGVQLCGVLSQCPPVPVSTFTPFCSPKASGDCEAPSFTLCTTALIIRYFKKLHGSTHTPHQTVKSGHTEHTHSFKWDNTSLWIGAKKNTSVRLHIRCCPRCPSARKRWRSSKLTGQGLSSCTLFSLILLPLPTSTCDVLSSPPK